MILMFFTFVVSVGCGEKLPSGFENRAFFNDIKSLVDIMIDSFATETYKEDDINKILHKISNAKYISNLNNYELSILDTVNDGLIYIKRDLESDGHVLSSKTYNQIEWVIQIFHEIKTK